MEKQKPIWEQDAHIQLSNIHYTLRGLSLMANPASPDDISPTEDQWYGICCLLETMADLTEHALQKAEDERLAALDNKD